MSKIFDRLAEIQKKNTENTQAPAPASQFKWLPVFVVLTAAVLFIQIMTFHQIKTKDKMLANLEKTLRQQQEQMLLINQSIADLKTSTVSTNSETQAQLNSINNAINTHINQKFDNFDQQMKGRVREFGAAAQKNADNAMRTETALKTNINHMNARLLRLQTMVNQVYQAADIETNITPPLNGE